MTSTLHDTFSTWQLPSAIYWSRITAIPCAIDGFITLWSTRWPTVSRGGGILWRPPSRTACWSMYFSAIWVSICTKLARSILMRDRNTRTRQISKNQFLNLIFFRRKTVVCEFFSPYQQHAAPQLCENDVTEIWAMGHVIRRYKQSDVLL